MITRLYVDNYRCLTNFELTLSPMTLLLGDNGTGKSSVLAVIDALCRIASDPGVDLGELLPASSLTRWDRRREQTFELDVTLDGELYRYALTLNHDAAGQPPKILSETVSHEGQQLFSREDVSGVTQISPRHALFALVDLIDDPHPIGRLQRALADAAVLHLDPRTMSAEFKGEARALSRDGRNFAAWYRDFATAHLDRQGALFERLAEALPGFRSLKIDVEGRLRTLLVLFEGAGSRYTLRFDELSEGQRALIVLYALLEALAADGRTLFIDEPTNHLALGEIQPWLMEISDHLGERGQVVLVSHHPDLIDYMAARDALVFSRDDAGPVRVAPLTVDRDAGLTASEVVRKRLLADG